jgi:hypothetical protein
LAALLVPSEKKTLTVPPSAAGATTWLLVRMCPSVRITTPEPVPCDVRPPDEPTTCNVTTLGLMMAAAASTVPAVCDFVDAGEASLVMMGAEVPDSSETASVVTAPVTPDTRASAMAPTVMPATRRPRPRCLGCAGAAG